MISYSTEQFPVINILLAGVGGQGVLLASDILVEVALQSNLDTKKSEVHGMAQRGGSVVSQVRFGEHIHSPLIPDGDVHLLVAFEKLEALRYLDAVRPDGAVIYNTQQITPLTVYFSNISYPRQVDELCRRKTPHVFSIDAVGKAEELGNLKVVNSLMLGALSRLLQFDEEIWKHVIGTRVPAKTKALNETAFNAGASLMNR